MPSTRPMTADRKMGMLLARLAVLASGLGLGCEGAQSKERVSAASVLPGCAAYPTVGKMDDFFVARCGGGECHATPGAVVFKDLVMPGIWDRMRAVKATVSCSGSAMIDTDDWSKSAIWVTTREPMSTCPAPGGTIIRTMPPQVPATVMPLLPPLSSDENLCLESYLKTIADGTF